MTRPEQPGEAVRFCKDCRHYKAPSEARTLRPIGARQVIFHLCRSYEVSAEARITGEGGIDCALARMNEGSCGKDARFFEPRPHGGRP